MSRFPRYLRLQLMFEDRTKVDRIVEDDDGTNGSPGATAGGDERRLRGIPAIGRGCGGAIRGTRPGDGLFR